MYLTEFKPGDYITRVDPVSIPQKPVENESLAMLVQRDPIKAMDFMGAKIRYYGKQNECFYLKIPNGSMMVIPVNGTDQVTGWMSGWEHYTEIPTFEDETVELIPDKSLSQRIKFATWKICAILAILAMTITTLILHDMPNSVMMVGSAAILGFGLHASVDEWILWKSNPE